MLLYEELHKRIAQLTETQQRRLALYYFHGLTYEQIAALCGDDVSTWGSTMQCESDSAWEVYGVWVSAPVTSAE